MKNLIIAILLSLIIGLVWSKMQAREEFATISAELNEALILQDESISYLREQLKEETNLISSQGKELIRCWRKVKIQKK